MVTNEEYAATSYTLRNRLNRLFDWFVSEIEGECLSQVGLCGGERLQVGRVVILKCDVWCILIRIPFSFHSSIFRSFFLVYEVTMGA